MLVAIYFNASFSMGDDARDECRAIADCLARTPSSIDRQWRNVAAVVRGLSGYNIGAPVKEAVADYLANPAGSRALAIAICEREGWPLRPLIEQGRSPSVETSATHESMDELRAQLQRMCYSMEFKVFSSGSQGYYRQGKIRTADGLRYQAQVTAVLIGSRRNLAVDIVATRDDVAFEISAIIATLEAKKFRTGRVGFYASGKVAVGGERFQVGMQAVRILDS